jgi:arginase family enzyme
LTGAVIFGLTYQQVLPQISALVNYGNTIIPDLWNVSPFLFIMTCVLMALLLFYLIDRVGWQRKERE